VIGLDEYVPDSEQPSRVVGSESEGERVHVGPLLLILDRWVLDDPDGARLADSVPARRLVIVYLTLSFCKTDRRMAGVSIRSQY